MHIPNLHKNANVEEVKAFLIENSFGILVSQLDGKISGTHIPMELDQDEYGADVLVGHIARANPQSRAIMDGDEVLAIFNGPHSYVSSSWYEKENVPTWNYIAVHVYGQVKIIEGTLLLDSLEKLVDKYERTSENPVSVKHMSSKTMKQINGIVGFSIRIDEIQAAYKLSQNKNAKDYHTITNELDKVGDANSGAIAAAMRKDASK